MPSALPASRGTDSTRRRYEQLLAFVGIRAALLALAMCPRRTADGGRATTSTRQLDRISRRLFSMANLLSAAASRRRSAPARRV